MKALDIDTCLDILSDLKILLAGVEQVDNLLVVNFQIGRLDQILDLGTILLSHLSLLINARKNVLKASLHEPPLLILCSSAISRCN
jgi:hypothetical protein